MRTAFVFLLVAALFAAPADAAPTPAPLAPATPVAPSAPAPKLAPPAPSAPQPGVPPPDAPTPAAKKADFGPPLRFQIVRQALPGCEPACAEWISAEGQFVQASMAAMQAALAQMGRRKLPIVVNSPGGDVNAAMAMGRLIRARGLDVAVGRTILAEPQPTGAKSDAKAVARGWVTSVNGWCASACSLFIAGAQRRFVSPMARIAVHLFKETGHATLTQRFYRDKVWTRNGVVVKREREWLGEKQFTSLELDRRAHRQHESDISQYLSKMGMAGTFMKLIEETPFESMHVLTAAELVDTRLLSDRGGAEELVRLYRPFYLAPGIGLPTRGTRSALAFALWRAREICGPPPQAPLHDHCRNWRALAYGALTAPRGPAFVGFREDASWSLFPPPQAPISVALADRRELLPRVVNPPYDVNADYRQTLSREIARLAGRIPSQGPAQLVLYVEINADGKCSYLSVQSYDGAPGYEPLLRQALTTLQAPPPPLGRFAAREAANFK